MPLFRSVSHFSRRSLQFRNVPRRLTLSEATIKRKLDFLLKGGIKPGDVGFCFPSRVRRLDSREHYHCQVLWLSESKFCCASCAALQDSNSQFVSHISKIFGTFILLGAESCISVFQPGNFLVSFISFIAVGPDFLSSYGYIVLQIASAYCHNSLFFIPYMPSFIKNKKNVLLLQFGT